MLNNIKFSYDDIMVVPEKMSTIKSRSECDPFYSNNSLPIFTAPMSSVICEHNINDFIDNNINVVIPRTLPLDIRLKYITKHFVALSLQETIDIFIDNKYNGEVCYITIDIANGHMQYVLDIIDKIKSKYKHKVIIMGGNIANPDTYELYNKVKCDYVRVGIGGGAMCTTSSNTAIHYPYGSLIYETKLIKNNVNGQTKIIADGNIKNFSDVIKSLALGADYVMIGTLFASMIESSADTKICVNPLYDGQFDDDEFIFENSKSPLIKERILEIIEANEKDAFEIYKNVYGMSTKKAQNEMGKIDLKTAEGIEKWVKSKGKLTTWTENMKDYLKSAMSYTNSRSLEEFIGNVEIVCITNNSINRINQ